MSVMLVMYHYIRDVPQNGYGKGLFAISPVDFQNQIERLLRFHEPVSPQSLLDCVRQGSRLPSNSFLLTFDDGLVDHWEQFSVLDKYRLKCIFAPIGDPYVNGRVPFVQKNQFVRGQVGEDKLPEVFANKAEQIAPWADVRRQIEEAPIIDYNAGSVTYLKYKYATNHTIPWDVCVAVIDALFSEMVGDEDEFINAQYLTHRQILELYRMGFTIAAHTIHHFSLPRLTRDEQRKEVVNSLDWLEGLLGERPVWLDYPSGDYNDDSQAVAKEAGVEIAYTTRPPLWSSIDQRFRVPRIDTCRLPTQASAPLGEWSARLSQD